MRWAGVLFVVAAAVSAHAQRNTLPYVRTDVYRSHAAFRSSDFSEIEDSARAPARGSGSGFPGLGSTGQFPANCSVGVGPSAVVQAVNGQIAYFTRDGQQTFGQSATTFFAGVAQTSNLEFPRVAFDRDSGRFFVVFLEKAGNVANFLVAVSDDSDPNGTWYQYCVNATTITDSQLCLPLRPSLGFNEDGLLLATTSARASDG